MSSSPSLLQQFWSSHNLRLSSFADDGDTISSPVISSFSLVQDNAKSHCSNIYLRRRADALPEGDPCQRITRHRCRWSNAATKCTTTTLFHRSRRTDQGQQHQLLGDDAAQAKRSDSSTGSGSAELREAATSPGWTVAVGNKEILEKPDAGSPKRPRRRLSLDAMKDHSLSSSSASSTLEVSSSDVSSISDQFESFAMKDSKNDSPESPQDHPRATRRAGFKCWRQSVPKTANAA
jgi:hypothetical protein